MLDLKYVRDNVQAVISELGRKGVSHSEASSIVQNLVDLDARHRNAIQRTQTLLTERNEESSRIATLSGIDRQNAIAGMGQIKALIVESTTDEREYEQLVAVAQRRIPNLLALGVPLGSDESHNREIYRTMSVRTATMNFEPKDHVELGEALGMMDFESAAKISGSRFVVTKGPLARMERALGQFMMDLHVNFHGFTEVNPPLIVNTKSLVGTGQLPKFEDDLYRLDTDSVDGQWLIPTAEVSITNLVRESIIPEDQLPLRYVALTPCFRAEAGSAGRDTRGMIRQHQFYKVELVSITSADHAEDEQENIRMCAQAVLDSFGLAYRTVLLCGGDTGFSAAKTYDIEVWLPSQKTFREISSISDFGDFQARRMEARYKPKSGKPRFVKTYNGSGVAVGRMLVAIMENFQNEDGSITVPYALRPYMNGLEVITK
jgi:seryl-tRNA synthetase